MNRCRIHPATPHPPADQLEALRRLPSTIVSDQLERYGLVRDVGQITSRELGILAGPALTVRTRAGDNLIIYKAIDIAEPGDILVIEAGGVTDRAVMGEIVYHHAQAKGIAGMVIDGCIRDGAEIAAGTLPVFAKGFAHPGPYKNGPGEIRGPVSVGGTVVRNGDLVVGDADGVAVVPRERLDETITGGEKALAREDEAIRIAKAGEMDTSFVDEQLEVEYVEDGTPERTEPTEVIYPQT
jgi:regulator of RNase E activity RraA